MKIGKLAKAFDWEAVRAAVNYLESDCVAAIQGRENALAWRPVFLRESDNAPFVKIDGDWIPVDGLPRFLRYEKVHRRRYDTATDRVIEIA